MNKLVASRKTRFGHLPFAKRMDGEVEVYEQLRFIKKSYPKNSKYTNTSW
jgi:hypothetical protein